MIKSKRAFGPKSQLEQPASFFGNRLTHAAQLDRLSVEALARGDTDLGFRFIDRRCRIAPLATAHHYVLRAEVLQQKLEPIAALRSLGKALELAPRDLQANRRMLTWARGEARIRSARILCECDDQFSVLAEAAKVLKGTGQSAAGSIRVFDTYIRGWIAWRGSKTAELLLIGDDFEELLPLQADAQHPLKESGFSKSTSFDWKRSPDKQVRWVYLRCGGETVAAKRIQKAFPDLNERKVSSVQPKAPPRGRQELSVVIPIYRDLAATRACLASVERELANTPRCKIYLVNDASPEPKMARLLKSFTAKSGAVLLTNARNMGFVGSVNRALALVPDGDIILLNSDTVLPGTAFQRLRETARKNPDIGTITPFSNNGEFTSFPVALRANPLPGLDDLIELDKTAARVNKNLIIDIPSGIGFCLFISAACFKAAGGLSDSFQGGYLEDVDFCLRAREKGFRNVCDPAVFVAHAGTRSFLADKRNLVLRNLPIIEERFPNDKAETQAFLNLDPLRRARASIEMALTSKDAFDTLIVTGTGNVRSIAEARAKALQDRGSRVWLAAVSHDAIQLIDIAGTMPQSLCFALNNGRGLADLAAYLRGLTFESIELTDPSHTPSGFLDILVQSRRPLDIVLADGGWVTHATGQGELTNHWTHVRRIIVPSPEGRGFLEHHIPEQKNMIVIEDLARAPKSRPRKGNIRWPKGKKTGACGIVCYGKLIDDFNLIRAITARSKLQTRSSSFVVLGETADDLALMKADNVFVTGSCDEDEVLDLCGFYGIDRLFAVTRRPLFGHPLALRVRVSGLPLSYFDWSFGFAKPRRHDLALDSQLGANMITVQLAAWMGWLR